MKLPLLVLLGALTLGLSSVAVAKDDFVITNWILAKKKQDCPTICRATPLKFVMMGGLDQKERKPLSICTTKKGSEWLVGYNRWKETTCTVGIGNEAFHGERYYCLCTTHGKQPLR